MERKCGKKSENYTKTRKIRLTGFNVTGVGHKGFHSRPAKTPLEIEKDSTKVPTKTPTEVPTKTHPEMPTKTPLTPPSGAPSRQGIQGGDGLTGVLVGVLVGVSVGTIVGVLGTLCDWLQVTPSIGRCGVLSVSSWPNWERYPSP